MDVILVANDVVPGAHMPVAAPGLRQWGIAQGLRAHGLATHLVVPRHVADKQSGGIPGPVPDQTTILAAGEIPEFIRNRAPSVVVVTNSNQWDLVAGIPGTRYVYDFFAPKVLELVCQEGVPPDHERLTALRERKIRALAGADAVIVNGDKKIPYVLAWLLQTDRDATQVPLLSVPMCVPVRPAEDRLVARPVRVGIAGYLQRWSQPGDWLDVVRAATEDGLIELHLLLPSHWGGGPVDAGESLQRLAAGAGVVRHQPKAYADFVDFLSGLDLVLDLFDRSPEREYAMVTRTVVALAAGRPVVHPPFTEVAPAIRDGEAGWLVDVDSDDLADTLRAVFSDADEIRRRAANAHRVATARFAPSEAVRPLVDLLRRWSAP